MSDIVISDASCLIAFERINQLDILRLLFSEICTTTQVKSEFGNTLPDWIIIRDASNVSKIAELEKLVDKGEASAIALALENAASTLIIDEKKGRRLALQLKVNIIGSLGLLLLAKQKGVIPAVKPIIIQLEQQGFRFSKEIVSHLLLLAGEK